MTASGKIINFADLSSAASTAGIDVSNFNTGVVQVYGTFVGTGNIQGSNDGTNWKEVSGRSVNSAIDTAFQGNTAACVHFDTLPKYLRITCDSYTSGTIKASFVGKSW